MFENIFGKKNDAGSSKEDAGGHEAKVTVAFTVPKFRYKGVEYVSAHVEAAAATGNEDANALINKLLDMNSGIVKIVNE